MDAYGVLQVAPDCEDEVLHSAFIALARKYHPDRDATRYAARRMVELTQAYALVRDAAKRSQHDAARRSASVSTIPQATPAGAPPPPVRSGTAGSRLTFGRYAGWTLRDLARQDPDYLRWLSRHSAGVRYRTEIYAILGKMAMGAA